MVKGIIHLLLLLMSVSLPCALGGWLAWAATGNVVAAVVTGAFSTALMFYLLGKAEQGQ